MTSKETKNNFLTVLWLSIEQYKKSILSKEEFLKVFHGMFDDEFTIEFKKKNI